MTDINLLEGFNFFNKDIPIYMSIVSELEYRHEYQHRHDFIEIAYVSSGKGSHYVGNTRYAISKGDLFIINYGTPHVFLRDSIDADYELIVYNCIFKPEFLDYSLINSNDFKDIAGFLMFNAFLENRPAISIKLSGTSQAEIEDLYRKMQMEYFSKPKGYINILRSCLIEMLTKIFRYIESKDNIGAEDNSRKTDIMSKAFEFLKENYASSEININEVAVRTFLSKSYFSKLFKNVTGQNFSVYLQNLRISEACTLLKTTDKKVTEILSDVGFKDVKNFNRLFKKITGKTPGEYRKS